MSLFKTREKNAFHDGLIALIESEYPKAIELLTKAAEQNHHNGTAFLVLGDVYRIVGQPHRAINIHEPLTLRSDLSKQEKIKVYTALGLDYEAAKDWKKATINYQKAVSLNGRDLNLQKNLFKALKKLSRWEEAYSVWENILKQDNTQPSHVLAYLEIRVAQTAQERKDNKTAEKKCRSALNLYPACVPARLLKGDLLAIAGKDEAAYGEWHQIIQNSPALAFLAFSRLEKNLFKKDHYDKMLDIYQEILQKCPQSKETHLALADFWTKRGNFSEALSQLKEARHIKPASPQIYSQLICLQIDQGKYNAAKEEVEKLTSNCEETCWPYSCLNCGSKETEFFFECPSCGEFETINGYF